MATEAKPKFKVILLGEQSVGKTSLVARFMYGTFEAAYQPTIGIDFLSKTMFLEQDRSVRLQLWDTAGQERFRALIPAYVRDSAAAVVAYDVGNRASFDETERWVSEVREQRGDEVVICLVGNKSDLPEGERHVSFEEGAAAAKRLGIIFCETSAKNDYNVQDLFREIALQMPIPDVAATKPATTVKLDQETASSGCAC